MTPIIAPIAQQLEKLRGELAELEATFPYFEQEAQNIYGSRKYRSIARRIVLSAQHLEELVKENTFSR